MRRRTVVIVVLIGLVVGAGASAASMYPSLSDAQDAVDEAWRSTRPALDARYEQLAAFTRAVRATGAEAELLDQTDDAVAHWEKTTKEAEAASAETEAAAANGVEAAGARLARSVTTRPSLRVNSDIVFALDEYLATDPTVTLQSFNDAVERYDNARSRFPGSFFASFLGFDAMETVEVPGALADLDVPSPVAPEPAPGAGEEAPATTTSAP